MYFLSVIFHTPLLLLIIMSSTVTGHTTLSLLTYHCHCITTVTTHAPLSLHHYGHCIMTVTSHPHYYFLFVVYLYCVSSPITPLGVGAIPSPFDCYLANRGLRTLHVRMKQHQSNAFEVARFLEKSPFVVEVRYPGQ